MSQSFLREQELQMKFHEFHRYILTNMETQLRELNIKLMEGIDDFGIDIHDFKAYLNKRLRHLIPNHIFL